MVELAYPSAILFTKTSLLHVVRPTGRRRATRTPDAPVYHCPHCPVLYLPSTIPSINRATVRSTPPFLGGMTLARFLRIRWEVLKRRCVNFWYATPLTWHGPACVSGGFYSRPYCSRYYQRVWDIGSTQNGRCPLPGLGLTLSSLCVKTGCHRSSVWPVWTKED